MIKITIKDLKGNTQEINVEDSANVSKIKSLITKKEELPPKLIFNGILLNDEDNLKNRKISNGSTLIKIERRKQKEIKKEESATLNTIKEATSQYTKEGQETDDMTVSKNMVEDVQKKLENLIHSFFGGQEGANNNENNNNTDNSPNNQQANSEPEPEIPVPDVEQDSLENLMSMGFPEVACKKALIFTNGNCEEALEWILQHSEDNDFNEPITQRQLKGLGLGAKPGNKRRNENEFVPHPLAFQRLTEMGFDENQVTEALRATNNDEQSAAAYLLGDGIEGGERGGMRGGMGMEGMDEFDDLEDNPLLLQNPLIRALLQNPAVQSGMTNPRVIQAFQRIMENPQSAGEYLRDPLIGPILMQVNSIISNHQPNDPLNNNNPVNNNSNNPNENNNNPPNTPNSNNPNNNSNNNPNNDNNNNNNGNNPNLNQQNNNNLNTPINNNNPNLPQDNNNNANNNNNLNINQNLFNNAVNLFNNFNQLNNLFYDDDDEEGDDLDEGEDLDEDEDDNDMNFD